LDRVQASIFLLDEEKRRGHGGLGWANAACTKMLIKELVEFLLFESV
jgi:hypothetical protein